MLLVKIGIKESYQNNFCNNDTVSILHYIWLCPIIKVFWQQVIVLLEEIFEISIELNTKKYNVQEIQYLIQIL
jgi:hypothetical protein